MNSSYFWLRRLHSLSGIWLSISFIVCFLLPLSAAIVGESYFNLVAIITDKIPLIAELEVVFVVVPLLFHAAVGMSVIYGSQFNVISYGSYYNWMYALQRLTGILIAPFIAYHIYATKIAFAFSGRYADYAYMQRLFAPTGPKVFYCLGIACVSFHIGHGIASAMMRWGITASRRAQDVASMTLWVVTIAISIWGARIILAF